MVQDNKPVKDVNHYLKNPREMPVKMYKREYIHHSAERGRESHRHTREITNYQKRGNIWESYFQLARAEEAEARKRPSRCGKISS